jgi:transposase
LPRRPALFLMYWRGNTARSEPRSDRSTKASWHRSCEASRRLEEIPGIGPIVATALVAEIGDWTQFRSGRNLAAWIGLVPKQHTTGGKDKLGSITKQGNRYLRWLLVAGAMAVIRYAQKHGTKRRPWLGRLMERRAMKVAAVALAKPVISSIAGFIAHGVYRPQRLRRG